jgi:hypothetical protein
MFTNGCGKLMEQPLKTFYEIDEKKRKYLAFLMRKLNTEYFPDLFISPLQVKILSYLYYVDLNYNKGLSRSDLQKSLHKPRTTIYDNIQNLNRFFPCIRVRKILSGKRGQPLKKYRLSDECLEGLEYIRKPKEET